jgi:hypothetical protein
MHSTLTSEQAPHRGCSPSQRSFRLRQPSQAKPGRCRGVFISLQDELNDEDELEFDAGGVISQKNMRVVLRMRVRVRMLMPSKGVCKLGRD